MSSSDANAKVIDGATIAPADAAAVLRSAADLIEPEGRWIQGHYWSGGAGDPEQEDYVPADATCFCMAGAVAFAGGLSLDRVHSYGGTFYAAMHKAVGRDPALYNDSPGRTQAEVVAALRKAADLADANSQDGQGPVRAQTPDDKPGMREQ